MQCAWGTVNVKILIKFHVPFDFGELEQHFVKAWVLDLPVCASHALHLFDQSLRDLGMVEGGGCDGWCG